MVARMESIEVQMGFYIFERRPGVRGSSIHSQQNNDRAVRILWAFIRDCLIATLLLTAPRNLPYSHTISCYAALCIGKDQGVKPKRICGGNLWLGPKLGLQKRGTPPSPLLQGKKRCRASTALMCPCSRSKAHVAR